MADIVGQDVDNVWFLPELLLERCEFRIDCLVFLGPLGTVFLLKYIVRGVELLGE